MPHGLAITLSAIAATSSWVLVGLAWHRRKRSAGGAFLGLALIIALWTTTTLLQYLIDVEPVRQALRRFQAALAVLGPVAWLLVIVRAFDLRWFTPMRLAVIALPGLLFALATQFLPYGPNGLIASSVFYFDEAIGRLVGLPFEPTRWYWLLNLPYTYMLLGTSAAVMLRSWPEANARTRRQIRTLLLALAFPALFSTLLIFGINLAPGHDLIGLSLGAAALVLITGMLRSRLLDRPEVAYRAVFEAMNEAALVVSEDGHVLETNPAAGRLLGHLTDHGLVNRPLLQLSTQLEQSRRVTETANGERRPLKGVLEGLEVSVSHLTDHRGRLTGSVMVIHDQRQERERAALLLAEAHHDALTGVANRRGLETTMAEELRHLGDRRALGLAYVDLDGFKSVNDNYGHAVGDAVLIEVARRMQALMREGDTVARLGGDEFAMLLRNATPGALASVRERMIVTLKAPITAEGRAVVVGASIGLAAAPHDGNSVETLLEAADKRMYREKRGRAVVAR